MKISNYNDGYISIYDEIPNKTDFNARKNIKSLDNLVFIMKLAYEECSKRQQDMQFAESNGKTLSLKLKTRYVCKVNTAHKVVLINTLYDIITIDYDRKKQEMYFYLEKVRDIVK